MLSLSSPEQSQWSRCWNEGHSHFKEIDLPCFSGIHLWKLEGRGKAYSVQSVFTLPKAASLSLTWHLKKKKTVHSPFTLKVLQERKGLPLLK